MAASARRVALVTGGARGIGHAIAQALSVDHDVVITWNTTQPRDLPPGVTAHRHDLTREDACAALVAQIIDSHGRLEVIVNNAGVVAPSPVDEFDGDAHRHMLDVNLLVPHALLAAALPHLKRGASIVNITSMNAELPPRGAVLYGASKAALNLWTRGVAKELGPQGIRLNAVAPGAVNLPGAPRSEDLTKAFVSQTALERIAVPDDIAGAVAFLVSDAASFITGEILTVSGGYRL